ncbi:hypothetical protein NUH88_19630 [Nisaea acidiphila]|uniref:EF-hand domain-containing protein n=1 Tax=Nisaea acidiphila TaxID=1862145 RepID=A0A9J7AQY7_9PROT|nr:hypothetical protein [Nisaea acidiphila]UUX49598.1 hypothetical protein NUH88_19630 [Nisaea acidiphila]
MNVDQLGSGYFDYAAMRDRFQTKVTEADIDGSGGLSFAEFQALKADAPAGPPPGVEELSAEERFSSLDADGDGEVTFAEFEAARPNIEPQFSAESFTELLAAQEESANSSVSQSTTDDLLSQLLAQFQQSGADAAARRAA